MELAIIAVLSCLAAAVFVWLISKIKTVSKEEEASKPVEVTDEQKEIIRKAQKKKKWKQPTLMAVGLAARELKVSRKHLRAALGIPPWSTLVPAEVFRTRHAEVNLLVLKTGEHRRLKSVFNRTAERVIENPEDASVLGRRDDHHEQDGHGEDQGVCEPSPVDSGRGSADHSDGSGVPD